MSDQETPPSPDADPELAPEGTDAASPPDPARVPATHSSDDVMGTGEGPPPGTRVEAVLITLIGLAVVLLPVLGVLRRMADSLVEAQRWRWLEWRGVAAALEHK